MIGISMIAITTIIIAGTFGVLFVNYFVENTWNREYNTKIKFKDFKTYYILNPFSWHTHETYVSKDNVYKDLYFGYIDYYRYRYFLKSKKSLNEKEKKNETYRELLASVQKDIDDIKKQAEEEVKEAKTNTYDFLARYRKLYKGIEDYGE